MTPRGPSRRRAADAPEETRERPMDEVVVKVINAEACG